jgi:hypothetical protein
LVIRPVRTNGQLDSSDLPSSLDWMRQIRPATSADSSDLDADGGRFVESG